jgi:hypothetical protein
MSQLELYAQYLADRYILPLIGTAYEKRRRSRMKDILVEVELRLINDRGMEIR